MKAPDRCDGSSGPGDEARVAALVKQGLADPPACLEACTATVMRRLLSSSPAGTQYCGAMTADICGALQTSIPKKELYELYWCDSTYCGVSIDRRKGLGQDPMVSKIINRCQDIGFHEVFDPGPPSAGYTCPFYVNFGVKTAGDGCTGVGTPSTPPQQSPSPPESIFGAAATGSSPGSRTTAPPEPTHDTAGSTSTMLPAPPAPAAESAAGPDISGGGAEQGLSAGAKSAIAVCSAVAVVALAALAFLVLRVRRRDRRRKSSGSTSSREEGDGGSFVAGLRSAHIRHNRYANGGSIDGGSGTQRLVSSHASISTAGSNLHSPPPPLPSSPRLWDRKRIALPAIFTRRAESPPLTPLGPASESGLTLSPLRDRGAADMHHQQQKQLWQHAGTFSFPSSPICTPTINKLEPRHERTPSSNKAQQQQQHMIGQGVNDVAMAHMDALPPPPPPPPPHSPAQRGQHSPGHPSSRGGSVSSVTGGAPSSLRNEFTIPGGVTTTTGSRPGTPRHPPPPMPPPTQPLPSPPPLSPTRPPRPHETPLEIPGLLTAAPTVGVVSPVSTPSPRSPPPVSYHRVMPPSAAASSRRSPGRKGSSSSLASSAGASPVHQQQQQQPGRGQRVAGPAPAPLALRGFPRNGEGVEQIQMQMQMQMQMQLSGEARDLRELTQEYAREQSTGDRPVVMGGAAPSPGGRKGKGKREDSWPHNRREEELDLESLGGVY
ncbi:hypothetical protein RB595_005294 [Gaeumannomyces hyphopodioides]